jgi:hypothetical protein
MRPLYIVTEEAWSIWSKANERKLLGSSERPLFSGGAKLVAYAFAKQRASEFTYHGVHDEGGQLYWWGRNEGNRVSRRFVIKPAPPRSPLFLDKDGHPRGRPSRDALPTLPSVEAPGPALCGAVARRKSVQRVACAGLSNSDANCSHASAIRSNHDRVAWSAESFHISRQRFAQW